MSAAIWGASGGGMGGMFERLAVAIALLLVALPAWAAPDLSGLSFDQRLGSSLPLSLPFTDEAGRETTLAKIAAGLPLVIAFGYTKCPGFCGVVRDDAFSALARTGLAADRDYRFVFLSIDPAERPGDAQAAKLADMARYPTPGAPAGWRFLTGPAASLNAAQRAAGFRARFDPGLKQFFHPAGLVFATAQGTISGYVMGLGYTPGDVRAAIVRAQADEIGQLASPALLLCFHFDPHTGRYTLAVAKILKLGAALTIVGIAGIVFVAQRRAPAA